VHGHRQCCPAGRHRGSGWPSTTPAGTLPGDPTIPFSSGYLQRARDLIPNSAPTLPWRLNQDYFEDCRDFAKRPVADGILRFTERPAMVAA